MYHYQKIKDNIINWDGVNFPTGNIETLKGFKKTITV